MKFQEKFNRSILKAITFRIIILLADGIVIFFITKSYQITIGVIILSNLSSTILYYLHERVWNKITWGKKITNK